MPTPLSMDLSLLFAPELATTVIAHERLGHFALLQVCGFCVGIRLCFRFYPGSLGGGDLLRGLVLISFEPFNSW